MAASPLDQLPPDGEAKAGDGGENQSFTWCEEPVVESACADAAHDGELVLGFFAGQLRKRGPRHAGDMGAHNGRGAAKLEPKWLEPTWLRCTQKNKHKTPRCVNLAVGSHAQVQTKQQI